MKICAVEGCSRASKAHGMCFAHHKRQVRTGDPGPAEIRTKVRTPMHPECTIDGCDRPHSGHGLCKAHLNRKYRTGDPGTADLSTTGAGNGKWVGEDAGYDTAHKRLIRTHGPASKYPCTHCGRDALHWAYDHADPGERTDEYGTYSLDASHYFPLCASCHKTFDLKHKATITGGLT